MTWWLFKRFLFSKRSGALIRSISWICVSGIGVGVFALVLVMSVMNGFNEAIRSRLLKSEPHLVVTFNETKGETQWGDWQTTLLADHPELAISDFEVQDLIIKTDDGHFGGVIAKGLEQHALEDALIRLGWSGSQLSLESNSILLGIGLAHNLQLFEGDEISLIKPEDLLLPPGETPQFDRVLIKGFLSTPISEIDNTYFYYVKSRALGKFKNALSIKRGVEIWLPDPLEFASMKELIAAQGFDVQSWKDRNSALFRALKMEKVLISTFLGLSTVIASFSIITVLILLSAQKRREFGLMMAMGMSAARTKKMFIKLGVLLSGLGMGGGLVLGTLFAMYLEKYPLNILPNIYQDSRIPAIVDYQFILFVAFGATLVSVVAAWYPSGRLSKMLPAEVLRGRD